MLQKILAQEMLTAGICSVVSVTCRAFFHVKEMRCGRCMDNGRIIESPAEIKIGDIRRGSVLCCNQKEMAGTKQIGILLVAEGTMDGSLYDMQLPVRDDYRFAIVLGQPGIIVCPGGC